MESGLVSGEVGRVEYGVLETGEEQVEESSCGVFTGVQVVPGRVAAA